MPGTGNCFDCRLKYFRFLFWLNCEIFINLFTIELLLLAQRFHILRKIILDLMLVPMATTMSKEQVMYSVHYN